MYRSISALSAFVLTAGLTMTASGQTVLLDDDLSDLSNLSQTAGTLTLETEGSNSFARLTQSGAGASLTKFANLGAGLVNPGDPISVSIDLRLDVEAGGVGAVEFFTELSGGGTSSTLLAINEIADIPSFQTFTFDTIAGDPAGGGVTVQVVAIGGGAPGSSSVLDFDNASVTVIPEPASLALLGLGGIAMLGRRRRGIA